PAARRGVYVVREGKAHRTTVLIGTQTATDVEVIDGLKPGDLVVADPKGLKGETVRVEVKEKPRANPERRASRLRRSNSPLFPRRDTWPAALRCCWRHGSPAPCSPSATTRTPRRRRATIPGR